MKFRNPVLKTIIFMIVTLTVISGCSDPKTRIPKIHIIDISSMQFNPAELTVEKGDTVKFINNDMVAHDITEQPDKTWNSSLLSPGQSYKITIWESSGYYCSIHPTMKGMITVQ